MAHVPGTFESLQPLPARKHAATPRSSHPPLDAQKMKTFFTSLLILLTPLASAFSADRPVCEITAHCFSMSAKDAGEFTLTYNPAGQAGFSIERLDEWVAQKRAVSLGTLSTKGQSGLYLKATGKEFSLDTETVAAKDGSSVNVASKLTFPDQTVIGSVSCPNRQFAFAGNSTPKDYTADSKVYFIYLVSQIGDQQP